MKLVESYINIAILAHEYQQEPLLVIKIYDICQFIYFISTRSMRVLKFGGTSVGTADSIVIVSDIIRSGKHISYVVVSAMKGMTDALESAGFKAADGDLSY